MTRVAFVIPGDLGLPTGGYAYDRRVLDLLPQSGLQAVHVELPGTYPAPSPADLDETARRIAATKPDDILLIDGLAYGTMPAALVRGFERRIVALVHHPLCLEAGTPPDRAADLKRLETDALALARHVVVTSPTTARTLVADFGVPEAKITVAEPGTDPAPRAKGSGGNPVRILAVGSIVPRKAYDMLVEALVPLKVLPWRLDIAGSKTLSPATAEDLAARITREGFDDRITVHGAVSEAALADLYDNADLFVLASHYEGFGMVLTEALARGLPIVMTTGGAAADTVPEEAALKVEPGSPRAFAWTLGRAIDDPKIRQSLADASWAAGQRLPRWEGTALSVASAIRKVTE